MSFPVAGTECLLVDKWEHPYTREVAAYPLGKRFRPKVWPPVRRIDGAYGDRNLVCSCPPTEAYETYGTYETNT
jgi:glycine dehydrogenase